MITTGTVGGGVECEDGDGVPEMGSHFITFKVSEECLPVTTCFLSALLWIFVE